MNYEKALRDVSYSVPKTIKEIQEKAKKAEQALNSIRLNTMKTTRKCEHAYRDIVEEGIMAAQDGYVMPELVDYKADVESLINLKNRFETAIDDFKILIDNNFDTDPDNLSKFEIDRLVDLLFRLEARVTLEH